MRFALSTLFATTMIAGSAMMVMPAAADQADCPTEAMDKTYDGSEKGSEIDTDCPGGMNAGTAPVADGETIEAMDEKYDGDDKVIDTTADATAGAAVQKSE